MGVINLWDPKPSERSKTSKPGMGAKKERANRSIWSVDVDFDGKVIKDFPLTYVVKHNSPWIYFEILKNLNPPIMSPQTTPQQATTGTDTQGSLVARFTSAINDAIDKKLVPIDPQYANAKIIFTTLSARLHHAAQRGTGNQGGETEDDKSSAPDFMETVVKFHPDAMALVPRNSPAWNAVRGRILQELNQGELIAGPDGTANTLQQKNIEARGGPIRSIILNTLRALHMLRD